MIRPPRSIVATLALALSILIIFSLYALCAESEALPTVKIASQYETGDWGYSTGKLNGSGDRARFNRPQGMIFDTSDGLLIADTYNHCIRRVDWSMPGKPVEDILGRCGKGGLENEFNPGAEQESSLFILNTPVDIAIDPNGRTFYVLDSGNNRIIQVFGEQAKTLNLKASTPNGGTYELKTPLGIHIDRQHRLIIADSGHHRLLSHKLLTGETEVMAGTGSPGYDPKIRDAGHSRLNKPCDIEGYPGEEADTPIFVADSTNGLIRWIRTGEKFDWLMSNFAGSDNAMLWDSEATGAQRMHIRSPYRLAVGNSLDGRQGILFISQPTENRILGITLTRSVFIAAGEGAKKEAAKPSRPLCITVDHSGRTLYVFDEAGRLSLYSIAFAS